jgi:hypothetical protein
MAWASSDVAGFRVVSPQRVGWQPINETSTTLNHKLGTRVTAEHDTYGPVELIYLKGVASTVIGDWVNYEADDYTTSRAVANGIGAVGVALSANVANQYGWYAIYGRIPAKVLAAFADNGHLYLTATAGSADDAIVAGDRIQNARGASAIDGPATGMAEVDLYYPFTNDGLAD